MESSTMGMTEGEKRAFQPVAKVDTGVPKDRIAISDAAVEAARAALARRGTPGSAIRAGIRGGGCSGFNYVIEFDDDPPRANDIIYEMDGGEDRAPVRFLVDKKSMLYLGGSVLDFEKKLMSQGFKFKNPHEASKCGCGGSFTVS
jgi:iron-sulfur cluster assembly protein